jgi:XTP/dITP diphosphohydrolase
MPHSSAPAGASAPPGAGAAARLVVASANPGKLREFRALLADMPFEVVSQTALGVAAPEETGASFLENALLKARHAALATGAAVVADDSGLEVDALGGAPGIYSARYAGPGADDAANNAKLLAELSGIAPEMRSARYRCVLVFLPAGSVPTPTVAEGVWEGRIALEARGRGGFGYDPYFWLPSLGCSAAELDAGDKNRLSHRGQAMRLLQHALRTRCDPRHSAQPPP